MAFVCQRCKQPVKLDESIADLSPSTYDMVSSSLSDRTQIGANLLADPDRIARLPPGARQVYAQATAKAGASPGRPPVPSSSKVPRRGPAESFVVLTESTIGATPPPIPSGSGDTAPTAKPRGEPTVKHKLNRLGKLFDLISGRGDVDHPLCSECTQWVLETMEQQVREAKLDRDRYAGFVREVGQPKEGEVEAIVKELEGLRVHENNAVDKLKAAEREREMLLDEMAKLEKEESELAQEEEEFWRDYNAHTLEADRLNTAIRSTQTAYANDLRELEKLQRTNVYNDAFCIGHEGGVATINGLRLGRLPDVPVEWTEINAAWGHTALMVQSLAKRMRLEFEGRKIVPMGSFSRIERTRDNDRSKFELYFSEDNPLTRILHNRRFDSAMVELLECIRQLCERATGRNPRLRLPHRIEKDKIGDVSVKLGFSSESAWTRALKHVLLTLKILNANAD